MGAKKGKAKNPPKVVIETMAVVTEPPKGFIQRVWTWIKDRARNN